MRDIGDRHSGTAGGALNIGGKPVSVEVRLGQDAIHSSVQHTAWMLMNLLCRLTGAVREVRLRSPTRTLAVSKLSPHVKSGLPLGQALLEGIGAIGTEQDGFVKTEIANESAAEVIVSVGYQFDPQATFCVVGNGMCGGLFSRSINLPMSFSNSSIGPYIAACLAAAEIFRYVRLMDYEPHAQIFLDATSHSHNSDPMWNDIDCPSEFAPCLLAGVGAVGTALLHALFPLPISGTMFLADNDPKGLEDTNLGRYSLGLGPQYEHAASF